MKHKKKVMTIRRKLKTADHKELAFGYLAQNGKMRKRIDFGREMILSQSVETHRVHNKYVHADL